jgi:hypothetical protein
MSFLARAGNLMPRGSESRDDFLAPSRAKFRYVFTDVAGISQSTTGFIRISGGKITRSEFKTLGKEFEIEESDDGILLKPVVKSA